MPPLSIRRKMRPVVTTRRRAALRLVTDLELPSSDLEELEWLPDLAGVDDDDAQLTTVAHRSSGRCDRIEIDLDIEDSGERPILHFDVDHDGLAAPFDGVDPSVGAPVRLQTPAVVEAPVRVAESSSRSGEAQIRFVDPLIAVSVWPVYVPRSEPATMMTTSWVLPCGQSLIGVPGHGRTA